MIRNVNAERQTSDMENKFETFTQDSEEQGCAFESMRKRK